MKKKYITPEIEAVILIGPMLMTSGSQKVQEYTQGADILIGDTDDEQ